MSGKTVEPDIQDDIRKILLDRPSIDDVRAVQAQWEGPYLFSYKADLDFDGTYIAARLHERTRLGRREGRQAQQHARSYARLHAR